MNDRYLFRGKRTDRGEWVYGLLGRYNADYENANIIDGFECLVPVKTKTIGQYTGLTDKNGKRIFERDIVYCKSRLDNANMVIIFECGQFRMVLAENYRSYQTNSGFYDINCFDKEVIGNIHDNPELLKGE